MGKIVTFRPEDSEADHSLLFASTKRDKEHPISLIWKSLTCEQALQSPQNYCAHLKLSFTKHLTAYFKLEILLCF